MSDTEIKSNVVAELIWDDRIDASKIDIEVDNGVVTLHGEVPSMVTKRIVEEDTFQVMGVLQVINELDVAYLEEQEVPSDKEIAKRVENMFLWDVDLNSYKLDIGVSNGYVNISGIVDALWKKIYAENLAMNIAGVVDVTNKIAIVPTEGIVDSEIAQNIEDSLERRFAVDVDNVDVKVEDGKVTLSGRVDDWGAWRAAMDSAIYTTGTIDVIDDLEVAD